MIKHSILIFFILFLFVSCSKSKKETLVLASQKGIEVWISGESNLIEIVIDEKTIKKILPEDMSLLEFCIEIFGDNITIYEISGPRYLERRTTLDSFINQSGKSSDAEAFRSNKAVLNKSEFIKTLSTLSLGFDQKLYSLSLSNKAPIIVFDLSYVLEEGKGFLENKEFIKIWLEEVKDR